MPHLSPLSISLLIVLAVAFVGAFIFYLRDRRRFRGYQDLTGDVLRLARTLKGDVFRDGDDLVANGSWNDLPVQVRFSQAENTPGLNIRMGAPAGFTLSVTSARSQTIAGRVLVRTSDEMFNVRCDVRSDHPTHARLFLGTRNVMACLQKLCGSSQSMLLISTGQLELSEMGYPNQQAARAAAGYMEPLGALAKALSLMPGAEEIKIEKFHRARGWTGRAALAIGTVAVIAALVMAARPGETVATPEPGGVVAAGVQPADAEHIPNLAAWRAATPNDFDGAAVAWMRDKRLPVESRVEGDFCVGGNPNDIAYVLVGADNSRRLVVLCQGEDVYDSRYSFIGMVQRIPQRALGSIQWSVKPVEEAEGDALLITRAPDDPASGLVLYMRGRRIITGVPINYQNVKLD